MIEHPKIHTLPEFYLSQAALSFNSVCNAKCKFCCGRLTKINRRALYEYRKGKGSNAHSLKRI